jgi:hypothetical protein
MVVNAELMSFLLPLRTNRYSYHLCEILILISAAAVIAGADVLMGLARAIPRAGAYRWYVGTAAAGAVLVATVMASGHAVRTAELDGYVTTAYDVDQLRNPNWCGITDYLLAHMGKNDALIALYPHAENFEIAERQGPTDPRRVDYWLESKLIVEATIGDALEMPRDRRSGAKMLYNVDQIDKLFSEHDRIWYCTMRYGHSKINESIVSKYLREHMDVVYEDFGTALMVRDRNSRPANVRLNEEDAGELASGHRRSRSTGPGSTGCSPVSTIARSPEVYRQPRGVAALCATLRHSLDARSTARVGVGPACRKRPLAAYIFWRSAIDPSIARKNAPAFGNQSFRFRNPTPASRNEARVLCARAGIQLTRSGEPSRRHSLETTSQPPARCSHDGWPRSRARCSRLPLWAVSALRNCLVATCAGL